MPPLQLDVRLVGSVRQFQRVTKQINLTIAVGPGNTLVNFLQEHDVGMAMPNRLDYSLRPVEAVNATNPLVNVVGDQRELHNVAPNRMAVSRCTRHPRQTNSKKEIDLPC